MRTAYILELVNLAANPQPSYLRQGKHNVYSMPLWSMTSKPDQITAVQQFDVIKALDDHLRDDDFGSWSMEAIVGQPIVRIQVRSHALSQDMCGTGGSQQMLNSLGGLGNAQSDLIS
jgi:hypothetical protein